MTNPVVFVHGVRTSSAIWMHQIAVLSHLGHRCVPVDLPGHGRRMHERFTLERAMGAVDEAVRSLPEPPLLVGLSLGGYTSLAYAARHPDTVAGVVLAGCSTEIRGWPLRGYRRVSGAVARVLGRGSGSWRVVTDMLASLHGYSSLTDLPQVGVPVWFVNGQWDALRFGERRLVAARPGTRLTVIRGAGHDVNSHAPAAFTGALLAALEELAPGADAHAASVAPIPAAPRPRAVLVRDPAVTRRPGRAPVLPSVRAWVRARRLVPSPAQV
jgi:pimeloyl-ACP methyl ester carboxylesterase